MAVKLKHNTNMSEVRCEIWIMKTGKKKSLPPTTAAFIENVKRAHLQTCIGKATLDEDPPNINPIEFGWSRDDQNKILVPVTMPSNIQPAPSEVLKMI